MFFEIKKAAVSNERIQKMFRIEENIKQMFFEIQKAAVSNERIQKMFSELRTSNKCFSKLKKQQFQVKEYLGTRIGLQASVQNGVTDLIANLVGMS